jgi:hypothetical protein
VLTILMPEDSTVIGSVELGTVTDRRAGSAARGDVMAEIAASARAKR